MSNSTNQWKLGLFVVMGVASVVASVIYFGGRSLRKEAVPYTTYFDESVQGLEVGSPVKFRGVSIGSVSQIDLAGDRRHVAVTYDLGVKVLHSLGLAVEDLEGVKTEIVVPNDLRVQLASSGITGVKFIQMDFFDVKTNPPQELPFEVDGNTIPAASSMMKSLENSVVQAVERFPELVQQLVLVFTQINTLMADVEDGNLLKKLGETVALVNKVLAQVSGTLAAADVGQISKEVQRVITSIDALVVRVGGEKGLAASLQNTSDSLGSMAKNANHVGPAIEDTLRDVQGAAQSLQRLADAIESDPDMLLKGRARKVKQ